MHRKKEPAAENFDLMLVFIEFGRRMERGEPQSRTFFISTGSWSKKKETSKRTTRVLLCFQSITEQKRERHPENEMRKDSIHSFHSISSHHHPEGSDVENFLSSLHRIMSEEGVFALLLIWVVFSNTLLML